MRRTMTALAATLLLVAFGSVAAAQDATEHPGVGAWVMEDGGIGVVHADGTFTSVSPDGEPGLGAWEPAGDDSIDVTFIAYVAVDESGTRVPAHIRGVATLGADGSSVSWSATVELPTPDGGTTGQLGPVELTGTRIAVDAPGEPVGPFPPEMPAE